MPFSYRGSRRDTSSIHGSSRNHTVFQRKVSFFYFRQVTMVRMSVSPILLSLLLCLLPTIVEARWATPSEDASFWRLKTHATIHIKKDGSFRVETESLTEVRKEQARKNIGTFRATYNSRSSKLEILEAYSLVGKKKFPVDPEFIQDKPLASTRQGFDQMNQILVAFPKVDTGVKVYLKTELEVTHVPFKGFFSQSVLFGRNRLEKEKVVEIHSELPLFFEKNDPQDIIRLRSWKKDGLYHIKIWNRKPAYYRVVDERKKSTVGADIPWVDISTSKDWAAMVEPVREEYERIVESKLPWVFKKILKKAKDRKDPAEQINIVTSELANSVHYMGDWRPINGGHVPRELKIIAKTNFGDCKDLSATTTAILRKLGYKANVAFIRRGWNPLYSPTNLPRIGAFNHAIVRAEKNGKVFWIDPTNFTSFAQGIFEDIINRKALVMDNKQPYMAQVPKGVASDSLVEEIFKATIPDTDHIKFKGNLSLKGRAAITYTGARLKRSKKSVDLNIIRSLGDESKLEDWKVGRYNLDTRIVRNLDIDFQFNLKNTMFRTSAGPAFPLPNVWFVDNLLINTKDRVSDHFLGQPVHYKRKIRISNLVPVGGASLNCTIKSPWADVSRRFETTADGATVMDDVVIHHERISRKDLQSKKYAELQRQLRSCFDGSAIIYEMEGQGKNRIGKLP